MDESQRSSTSINPSEDDHATAVTNATVTNVSAANTTANLSAAAVAAPPAPVVTAAASTRGALPKEDPAKIIKSMENTLALQERMISALEVDNKRLVIENKKLRDAAKSQQHNSSARFDPSPEPTVAPPHIHATAPAGRGQTNDSVAAVAAWNTDLQGPSVPKAFMDAEVKRLAQRHEEELKDMARKVAWYVDNQEFNRAQEQLVTEQQNTIHELRARLMELEGLVGRPGSAVRTDKDKQLRLLQQRVLELEDALKGQNPSSLTELIRACRPPAQEQRAYKALEAKLREAEEKLHETEERAQATIGQLRIESDAMRVQYAARLEKVSDDLRKRLADTQTRRLRDAEKAFAEYRKTSAEKIKALERDIQALRRGVPGETTTTVRPPTAPRHARPPLSPNDSMVDGGLNRSHSPSTLPTGEPRRGAPASHHEGTHNEPGVTESMMTQRTLLRYERENSELRSHVDSLQQELQRVSIEKTRVAHPDVASSLQAQVTHLQSELTLHQRLLREAQDGLRNAHAQHEDRIYALRVDHQRAVDELRRSHEMAVASLHAKHKADMERVEADANTHAGQLRDMLATRASSVTRRDAREYLLAVAERLDAIERQEALRAMEFQRVVADARRLAESELAIERQKAELELRKKNQEIIDFQLQLDSLLAEVASLTWNRSGCPPTVTSSA